MCQSTEGLGLATRDWSTEGNDSQGSETAGGRGKRPGSDRAILAHPLRSRLYDLLETQPGLNVNRLAEELDEYPNLIKHHVRRLEENGLVAVREDAESGENHVFRSEDVRLWDDEDTRILFGRRPARRIGLYLTENPGATTKDIAESMELEQVTVRHHLRRLRESELVEQLQVGRRYFYRPQERLETWANDVGDGFPRPWES